MLAAPVEHVRRRTHRDVEGEDVLPRPGVEPVRVDADRQVVHDRDLPRRSVELEPDEPLQPRMEPHPIGVFGEDPRDAGAVGLATVGRPVAPPRTVLLGEHAPDGELAQRGRLVVVPTVELVPRGARPPDRLEDGALDPPDGIAVDLPALVEGASGRRSSLERVARVRRAGDVLDPQVQRVPIAAAGGKVGARLLGVRRGDRTHRVDEHETGPQLRSTTAPTGRGHRDRRSPSSATSGSRTAGRPIPSHAGREGGDNGAD